MKVTLSFEAISFDINADKLSSLLKILDEDKKIYDLDYNNLSLSPEEFEGLPNEILEELSESSKDNTENQILSLISENGNIINIDQIIVRLKNKFNRSVNRAYITNRIYKMTQDGILAAIEGKKGIYKIKENEK